MNRIEPARAFSSSSPSSLNKDVGKENHEGSETGWHEPETNISEKLREELLLITR